MRTLAADHGMTGISYSVIRNYVASLRGTSRQPRRHLRDTAAPPIPSGAAWKTPAMTWSPAHIAVEQQDLPRLRDLLDARHDVEDDDGHGWTLLRHAVDVEHDSHVQTGGPLHADVTVFLLARGADPLLPCNGMTVIAEAQTCGHWLPAQIMQAWTRSSDRSLGVRPLPERTVATAAVSMTQHPHVAGF